MNGKILVYHLASDNDTDVCIEDIKMIEESEFNSINNDLKHYDNGAHHWLLRHEDFIKLEANVYTTKR